MTPMVPMVAREFCCLPLPSEFSHCRWVLIVKPPDTIALVLKDGDQIKASGQLTGVDMTVNEKGNIEDDNLVGLLKQKAAEINRDLTFSAALEKAVRAEVLLVTMGEMGALGP